MVGQGHYSLLGNLWGGTFRKPWKLFELLLVVFFPRKRGIRISADTSLMGSTADMFVDHVTVRIQYKGLPYSS